MPIEKPATPKLRWFHPTPGRLLVMLLAVEGILLLSERFKWFGFNEHKGWTVLIAVAAVGVFLLLMLFWLAFALFFRRRFQFSIRSLLLLTVAVAVPCSWLAVEMKWAREQKEAVEAIEKLAGAVKYDYELDSPDKVYPSKPPAPAWLRNLLGYDFFVEIIEVNFRPNKLSLAFPRPAPWEFNERDAPPNDADLERLKGLPHLQVLILDGSVVTPAGLKHLSGLPHLLKLDLSFSQVTDDGLANLEGLAQLQTLFLDSTRVTDAGLMHIKGLRHLRDISLSGNQVTDLGLESLKGLDQLQRLDLGSTKVTDAGLAHLAGLAQLQFFDLQRTQVTDAGLADLPRRHPQLQELSLFGTKVTDAGIGRFQQAIPNCKMRPYHFEGMHDDGFVYPGKRELINQ